VCDHAHRTNDDDAHASIAGTPSLKRLSLMSAYNRVIVLRDASVYESLRA
jgi:hypothetical protein